MSVGLPVTSVTVSDSSQHASHRSVQMYHTPTRTVLTGFSENESRQAVSVGTFLFSSFSEAQIRQGSVLFIKTRLHVPLLEYVSTAAFHFQTLHFGCYVPELPSVSSEALLARPNLPHSCKLI